MKKQNKSNQDSVIFKKLRAILAKHENELVVQTDEPGHYYLNTTKERKKGVPVFFAAVKIGKSYVSYHLMPVYACPDLAQHLSPELRKRMQGKACFNFKEVDEALFKELAELTQKSLQWFKQAGWA
jgi:hypothetical protein